MFRRSYFLTLANVMNHFQFGVGGAGALWLIENHSSGTRLTWKETLILYLTPLFHILCGLYDLVLVSERFMIIKGRDYIVIAVLVFYGSNSIIDASKNLVGIEINISNYA